MRTVKQLEALLKGVPELTGGRMPLVILAESELEAEAIRGLLKGRRGCKTVTCRVARPGEMEVMGLDWRA